MTSHQHRQFQVASSVIFLVETAGGFGNGILNFDSAEELRQASVQELKRSFGEESEVRGWRFGETFAGGFKHVSFASLFGEMIQFE